MTKSDTRAPLLRRHAALEKLVRKYRGKPCDFESADCIRMIRALLVSLGHRPPKLPRYRSRAGAIRALRRAGFDNVEQLLDSLLLTRIPPAAMLPGDIAVMDDEDGIGAAVVLIDHKVMGWHQDHAECVMIIPHQLRAAWRVLD
ncbi:MAG: DUF6950 family protein [Allosphingosinicella sp.]